MEVRAYIELVEEAVDVLRDQANLLERRAQAIEQENDITHLYEVMNHLKNLQLRLPTDIIVRRLTKDIQKHNQNNHVN